MTTDPTHLGALQTGWDEGYLAGLAAAATDSEAENPHTKLFDDRRAYVEQQIVDTYGPLTTEDGDSLFDYPEVVDAILDAHTDWLAAQAANGGKVSGSEFILGRAKPETLQAEHLCQATWQGRLCRCVLGAGHPGEHRCSCGDRREGETQ